MRPIPQHPGAVKLYLVTTPIGNLKDITLRALEVLEQSDYILCEDTRRAARLKNHFSLSPRLISLHEHNERKRIPGIIRRMREGKIFSLISDAGTPLISDPGFHLIRRVIQEEIPWTCIPGPSAVLAALTISGLPIGCFTFIGFLPVKSAERKRAIERISKMEQTTLVLFESPKRIIRLLKELQDPLEDREIALCRELTKLHEEVLRGPVSRVLETISSRPPRGEFTLVIAPREARKRQWETEEIQERYTRLIEAGWTRKEALRELRELTGLSRNELYRLLFSGSA